MSAVGPPSPVGRSQGSSEAPNPLQDILNLHCKDYPTDRIPVGCNLVVMPGWEGVGSYLLTAGSIKPNGPQNWGSDSKQFTAACIDKLVRNEKLRYDQDISTLLDIPALLGTPRVPGPKKFQLNGEEQTITVDDLLCMRSGLPEIGAITLMSGIDAETLDNEELLNRLAEHPGMVFPPGTSPPGTTHQYCNTNYYLLAKIVENVSGRPFVDFVRKEVLAPLHMGTRCSIDPDCPQTIPGYDGDPEHPTYMQDVTSPNKSYGATGLIGPPEDMKQWNAEIALGHYGLLATPKAEDPSEEPWYCRGLSVSRVGDYRCISHGGMLGGAVVIYRRYEHREDPTKTFAFFLATNADYVPYAERTAAGIANEMAGEEVDPGPSPPTGEPSAHNREEDVKDLTGRYRCSEFGSEWAIAAVEQSPGSWGLHLEIVGGQFTSKFDFAPKIDGNGKLVFRNAGFGGGILELTDKGLVFASEKMAPVHFEGMTSSS